jgi:hypothetical protein
LATPVPLRPNAYDPLFAVMMFRLPCRVSVADGVKVTETVHEAAAASELPQVLLCPKSARPEVIDAIAAGQVPVAVTVKVCPGLVVPTVWELNVDGHSCRSPESAGAGAGG